MHTKYKIHDCMLQVCLYAFICTVTEIKIAQAIKYFSMVIVIELIVQNTLSMTSNAVAHSYMLQQALPDKDAAATSMM